VITRLILEHVAEKAGLEGVRRTLVHAGDQPSEERLRDEGTWVTFDQGINLLQAACDVLGGPGEARRIGETVLARGINLPTHVILKALGSPAGVLRHVPQASRRYSLAGELLALEVTKRSALLEHRPYPGVTPHVLDCEFRIGILSQNPVLFGLPPAVVEHPACRARGDAECLYAMRWQAHHRLRRGLRVRHREVVLQLAMVTERFELLQLASADLVSTDDIDTVLGLIVARASQAVRAERHLLVVRLEGEEAPRVVGDATGLGTAEELLQVDYVPDHWLVVEVASHRATYGRLLAVYPRGSEYFPEERRLLVTYARTAAAALDAAVALDGLRRRQDVSDSLLAFSNQLSAANDEAVMAHHLAAATAARMPDRGVTAYLEQLPHGQWLATANHEAGTLSQSALVPVVATPRSWEVTSEHRSGQTDDATAQQLMTAHAADSVIITPVTAGPDLLGLLVVVGPAGGPRTRSVSAGELAWLDGAARHTATALLRTRLQAQERLALRAAVESEARVRHQALHDPLTGLPNRLLFQQRIAELAGRPYAVLYLDVDQFKPINDEHGHDAGDRVLIELARHLRAAIRADDTPARLGGDEFAVLLAGADEGQARAAAARIVRSLEEPMTVRGGTLRVAVSIGVAVAEGDEESDSVLSRADQAMYADKRSRRPAPAEVVTQRGR